MAQYKVRNKRQALGRYQLSYGRGKAKLVTGVWYNDLAGGWQVDDDHPCSTVVNEHAPYQKLRDLKAAWGEWATEAYKSEDDAKQSIHSETGSWPLSTPPALPGPPPKRRKGPPKHKPSLKQQGPPKRKKRGNRPWPVDGVTDPFDPRFRYPSDHENKMLRQRHTPLAVVIEVWNALDNLPIQDNPALVTMYHELRAVIARECPNLIKENGRVQTPVEAAKANQQARKLDRESLAAAIRGRDGDEFRDDIPF